MEKKKKRSAIFAESENGKGEGRKYLEEQSEKAPGVVDVDIAIQERSSDLEDGEGRAAERDEGLDGALPTDAEDQFPWNTKTMGL